MEVRFKQGYISSTFSGPNNYKFQYVLKCMAGHWFEVETEYLFNNQFNIKGISLGKAKVLARRAGKQYREYVIESLTTGIRAFDSYCSIIIDDARIGRKLCHWCHTHNRVDTFKCSKCGKKEYFSKPFRALKTEDTLVLAQFYPRAYHQLPNSYKNDSCVLYSDDTGILKARGDLGWEAKWNGFRWVECQ